MAKPDFRITFKCDSCRKIIKKENTVFTKTSYGGKSWLCEDCARHNGIHKEPGLDD